MKNYLKKVISVSLCVIMFLSCSIICDNGFLNEIKLIAMAIGENHYMINGVSVRYDSIDGNDNNSYVKSLYNKIWSVDYTDDFNSSDNIIKNENYREREFNAENLAKYVSRCQPGAVLKVETISENEVRSNNGREFFIVEADSNGFTVFEMTNKRQECYYTWDHFCNIYTYSTIRFIKWPNSFFASSVTTAETDYKKPDRALYYDSVEMLKGDDVRWVQQKLRDDGYNVSVDGYFSKATESAIKLFQNDYSITISGIVDSLTADMLENPKKKPDAIELKVNSEADLSIGDVLTVSWSKVDFADSYHIFLYNSKGKLCDELDRVTTNQAAFVLDSSGTYTVKGYAQNEFFTGELSTMSQKVKVHNAYNVSFYDYDGTLLNKQSVAHGQDATVPPSPKRTGYSFKGWDTDFTNIKKPLNVTAQYIQKQYTVTFVDSDGNTIGQPQKVLYGESAKEPDTSKISGFVGWNKDFSFVSNSFTVTAVVRKADSTQMPISVNETSATRDTDSSGESESSGYSVYFKVTNNASEKQIGRAVVALKTTAGKFLTLTESSAFAIAPSASKAMKVFVPYKKVATIVEVYIVEDYSELIPLSNVTTIGNISNLNKYTDFLPDEKAPNNYSSVSNYRSEYSYRTKLYTSSTASSMPGWELDRITYTTSNSGWSSYTSNPISAAWTTTLCGDTIQTRFVETKKENYVSGYNIVHCATQGSKSPYYRHYWSDYNHPAERASYGRFQRSEDVSVSKWNGMTAVASGGWSTGTYAGQNKANVTGRQKSNGYIYFWNKDINSSKTYYRYQDKTINYTYHYFKWSDWSPWGTDYIEKTNDLDRRERQTRQYLVDDPTEVNTGISRTITGIVDSSLAGRQATLFIYKINEASDYTNEYVGQTTIGENGSYKFTFKLLEEPSELTGDYTVALGVEGTSNVIFLNSIEAPKPKYTVNFCDYDGTILGTQTVTRGESAVLPTRNPSRDGYTFAGWNYSNASIFEDTNITALYVQDEYTVTFIDWTNERFEMQTGYHYGDPLILPELNESDDVYEALGWDSVVDGMTVTRNMVITAKYDAKEFTVKFFDYNKNVIDEQTVRYGDSAIAPKLESDSECTFLTWDCDSFGCVTENLDVYPVYCYQNTVETPTSNFETGAYGDDLTVKLSCSTDGADIYYAIAEGESEFSEEQLYTGPISITESSVIRFYATHEGSNDSATVVKYYAINKNGRDNDWKYPVNFYIDNTNVATLLVNAGSTIDEFDYSNYLQDGYSFGGYYTDVKCENKWNIASTVNSPLTLYIKAVPKSYNVKFIYEDGTPIGFQSVPYLGAATPPDNVKAVNGKVFIKWDSDDYLCVTRNLIIKAVLKDESTLASITLNKTKLNTISGMSFKLVATIVPVEYSENAIVWKSSDNSVASVNEDGVVTAIAPGKAIITALLTGNEPRQAICEITVGPNNEEDITLNEGSKLSVDGEFLFGVKPYENTVSDILAEINSNSLIAYSLEGKELQGMDKMGTGSTICLVDNDGKILDAVTVIVLGDVNSDGIVNNKDASMIHRYCTGKSPDAFDEYELLAADVDGDGFVLTKDASQILQFLEGIKTVLTA